MTNQSTLCGNQSGRIVFIDYIRVVACFLVMLVHASENFYAADSSGLAGNVSMLANESNRFWEGDPALSTSYALLALSFVLE